MRALPIIALVLTLAACDRSPRTVRLSGETMGTTYHVTIVDAPSELDADSLTAGIDAVLADVNASMSNWDPDSEISRFNAAQGTDPVPVSRDLAFVIAAANDVHAASRGKFDVTLAPLIDLWGFGPREPGAPVPADADIAAALTRVGQSDRLALTMSESGATLAKSAPDVTVNLSAIAKGYGADRVGAYLAGEGIGDYLVEIGGDMVAAGSNPEGERWAIGIEKPDTGSRTVEIVLPVSDMGLATSGDYRNYFERDGVRYAHIIDPTTGRPVTHTTASVTVLAESGMLADAYATALYVVGADAGMEIAAARDLPAYFILREGERFTTRASPAFEALMNGE